MKTIVLVMCLVLMWAGESFALMTFNNLNITSNSISFNINGDMSGYTPPDSAIQFGIQYHGNLWVGDSVSFSENFWSQSPFDNKTFFSTGNTGQWFSAWGYTWSHSSTDLFDAVATNRDVTLTFAGNYLNPNAVGTLDFVWGWANSEGVSTVLQTFSTPLDHNSVPEPGTIVLLGLGMVGLATYRKRRQSKKA